MLYNKTLTVSAKDDYTISIKVLKVIKTSPKVFINTKIWESMTFYLYEKIYTVNTNN